MDVPERCPVPVVGSTVVFALPLPGLALASPQRYYTIIFLGGEWAKIDFTPGAARARQAMTGPKALTQRRSVRWKDCVRYLLCRKPMET